LSILIDQEFGEIPFDKAAQHAGLLEFQVFEQWCGIVTIDIHLERETKANYFFFLSEVCTPNFHKYSD
jgi:hypothetical protein